MSAPNNRSMTELWETFASALPVSSRAALLRIARRVGEGYEGEIQMSIKNGGVNYIRWVQLETGDVIKEELG